MAGEPNVRGGVRVPISIAAPLALVIQMAVAVILFLAIGAAAVVLNLATEFCVERNLAPSWAVQGMNALEMFLWTVDALCFVLFVLAEIRAFIVKVWGVGKAKAP